MATEPTGEEAGPAPGCVVVGVDGTSTSTIALGRALEIARADDVDLHVLMAVRLALTEEPQFGARMVLRGVGTLPITV